MQVVDLSYNNFQGFMPPFEDCTELKLLSLQNNLLTGNILLSFSRLPSLLSLSLSDNKLTGPIPQSLQESSKLQFLDLSHNLLGDKIPELVMLFGFASSQVEFQQI